MQKTAAVWLLVLLTAFVLTLCFSIIRLTSSLVELAETAGRSMEEISASVSEAASAGDAGVKDLLGEDGLRSVFEWLEGLEGF